MMDDEQLREILREDVESADNSDLNTEAILYVAGLLADRGTKRNEPHNVERAFEIFKKYYAPEGVCFDIPKSSAVAC